MTFYSLDELADFVSAREQDQWTAQLNATLVPSPEIMASIFRAELTSISINRGNFVSYRFEVQDIDWEWYRQRAQAHDISEGILRACAGEITITVYNQAVHT